MSLLADQCDIHRVPLTRGCDALGVNRSTVYSRRSAGAIDPEQQAKSRSRKDSPQPRALSGAERQSVRDTLNSEAFVDQPPAESVQYRLTRSGIVRNASQILSLH